MWEDTKEGEISLEWIRDSLTNGTFLGITNGSYDRKKAPIVSWSGWNVVWTACHQIICGSFIEISTKAGLYRGELLGLVTLHTIVGAISQYFHLDQVVGRICCDNIAALNHSSKNRNMVSTRIKHSDLHHTVQTLKCSVATAFKYDRTRRPGPC
jgi:hypothetical protein